MSTANRRKPKTGASKAKLIVLGVLFAVGLCVWIPPLFKGKSDRPAKRTPRTAPNRTTTTMHVKQAPQADRTPRGKKGDLATFDALQQLLDKYRLADVSPLEAVSANPFAYRTTGGGRAASAAGGPQKPQSSASGQAFDPNAATPVEAGLQLSATLGGGRFQGAVISGSVYLHRESVPRRAPGAYRIVSIADRQVTLSRGGQTFVLKMNDQEDALCE